VFGFVGIGFGTSIFLLQNRWYVVGITFVLLTLSIVFAARKIACVR
jgi:hypothetical protein